MTKIIQLLNYCYRAIQNKYGKGNAAIIIVCAIAVLAVAGPAIAVSVTPLAMMRVGEPSKQTSSYIGTVDCASWDNVGVQAQTILKSAAAEAGVHPAMLATLYWKENGEQWKPITGPFANSKYGVGPFQIMPSNFLALGLKGEDDAMDFTKAAYAAARLIRNDSKSLGISPSNMVTNEARALALSYNRGTAVAKEWISQSMPNLTAEKIVEYQDGKPPYRNYPLGNPGDFLKVPRNEDTQWWFAEVAYVYVTKVGDMFSDLSGACHTTNGASPSLVLSEDFDLSGYRTSSCGWVEIPINNALYERQDGTNNGKNEHWGTPYTISATLTVAKSWKDAGEKPLVTIGEISGQCVKATGHADHVSGRGVDIILRNKMMHTNEGGNTINDNYRTKEKEQLVKLAKLFIDAGATSILYNDSDVQDVINSQYGRKVMKTSPDHEAHFHVGFPR